MFKTKLNENGEVDKLKARLVANGFSQKFSIDDCSSMGYHSNDSKSCCFQGLERESTRCEKCLLARGAMWGSVYWATTRLWNKGGKDKVYKLKKTIYGLKHAHRAWYNKLESHFITEGFERCLSEHILFTKSKGGKCLIVSVYVDYLIFTGNDTKMLEKFKNAMKQEFNLSDIGKMKYFRGVEVVQGSGGIFINQTKYANEVLKRFSIMNCNPVKKPSCTRFYTYKRWGWGQLWCNYLNKWWATLCIWLPQDQIELL